VLWEGEIAISTFTMAAYWRQPFSINYRKETNMFDLMAGAILLGLAAWLGYQVGRQVGYEEATAPRKSRQNSQ